MQIHSLNQLSEIKTLASTIGQSKAVRVETPQQQVPAETSGSPQTERLRDLKSSLAKHNISLSFTLDDKTNQVIVKLVDENTGEAIRQTPSEVSLKLAEINANITGQFINGNF